MAVDAALVTTAQEKLDKTLADIRAQCASPEALDAMAAELADGQMLARAAASVMPPMLVLAQEVGIATLALLFAEESDRLGDDLE